MTESYRSTSDNGRGDPPEVEAVLKFWRHLFSGVEAPEGGDLLLCVSSGVRDDEGELEDFRDRFFPYPKAAGAAAKGALAQSRQGREVYFCAHLLHKPRRVKANAATVRALWADGDAAEIPDGGLKPTALVWSSPGRWQGYWRLSEAVPPEEAERQNMLLTRTIGADKGGWGLTKLLRVPGTTNHKYRASGARPEVGFGHRNGGRESDWPLVEDPEMNAHGQEGFGGDEPPVRLRGYGLKVWLGEEFKRKDDGTVDRSRSLFALGRVLLKAGLQPAHLPSFLEERDKVLGWNRYIERPIEYRKIADKLAANPPRGVGDDSGATEEPPPNGNDGEASGATDARPEVVVGSEDVADVMDAATSAMEGANDPPSLFVRAGTLSRVGRDEEGVARIQTVSADGLRERMARSARYVNVNTKGKRIPTVPPRHAAQMIHASGSWPWLPPLAGISGVPVLKPDGTVHDLPGYDPGSRIFYDVGPDGEVPPKVPPHPTKAQAEAALENVSRLIEDFPFAEEADRANALGMMLTPIARPWISGPVPLALIDKPKMGSGASLLAAAAGTIATGRAPFFGAPTTEEEWTKVITSAMLSGQTVLIFDNIAERLTSAALSRALTATTWQDRLLGGNVTVELPQRATWIATGNNVAVGGDLPRRCYRIRIDPKVPKPWQRGGFAIPDLLAHCIEQRGEIVRDLLTLCVSWHRAGRPLTDDGRPRIGGFEGWDRTISGILAHVGITDFLSNADDFYEAADEEGAEWEAFLAAWHAACGDKPLTLKDLVSQFGTQEGRRIKESLPTELAEIYEHRHAGFTRSLGRALTKKSGAMFGRNGYRAETAGTHNNATRWRVLCL